MGFLAPKPNLPPPPPKAIDEGAAATTAADARRRRPRSGFASTILVSNQGATNATKTLTGQ